MYVRVQNHGHNYEILNLAIREKCVLCVMIFHMINFNETEYCKSSQVFFVSGRAIQNWDTQWQK